MWRAIAFALVGYWFGEREGERRAHEGRFRTLPNGRRIFDDTAPGWNSAPRRAEAPGQRARGRGFIAVVALGLLALGAAHLLVNAFLILSGLILFFVGLARLV